MIEAVQGYVIASRRQKIDQIVSTLEAETPGQFPNPIIWHASKVILSFVLSRLL